MTPTLLVIFVLQLVGGWSYLGSGRQQSLTAAATTVAQETIKPVSVPIKVPGAIELKLEAGTSVLAIDASSGQVLFSQNASKPRPIASVTKLMTVMVALDKLKPDQTVTIGDLPDYDPAAERLGLRAGQQFSVTDLLKATLISSDNDAADALGIATAGSLPKFYDLMNAKAKQWGITGAHFASASGLTDDGNMVSAEALAKIAALDLASPVVRQLINFQQATIRDSNGVRYDLTTTNVLLAGGRFYGIKTGYTETAGQCFVGLTRIGGHEVITVVLGSSDRFGETQSLANWIGHSWIWP